MPPSISNFSGAATKVTADAVVVGVHENLELTSSAEAVDRALEGGLAGFLKDISFKAKPGDVVKLPTLGRLAAPVVVVAGLGANPPEPETVRRTAGSAAREVVSFETVGLALDVGASLTEAMVEGFLLGAYRFDRFKSDATQMKLANLVLVGRGGSQAARGEAIAGAVSWARDLVNLPGGDLNPQRFVELASERASDAGVEVEVFDEKQLRKLGMNGIATVGRASASPPRLLVLRYEPKGAKKLNALVGKGITFDAGGLSIKTTAGLTTMKQDCGGGAAVAAAMCLLPKTKVRTRVIAAIPLAENLLGSRSFRPGDVITHYGGKTSEVLSTDAEGRLVLADALAWITEQQPAAVVDVATLTGGISAALGDTRAGLFSNNDGLADQILEASERTGERLWRMPLIDEVREELGSGIADIKNQGAPSSVAAAMFLKEFVGDIAWAHLDIAGVAFGDKVSGYLTKGGTGWGTRLLIDWLEHRR